MNEWFRCGNQKPVDVMAEIFRMKNQKAGVDDMDDQERKSYEYAKQDVQKLMVQNQNLRDEIENLQTALARQDQEIRNRNSEGDALVRVIQRLTDKGLMEVQVTFRMKGYFDE